MNDLIVLFFNQLGLCHTAMKKLSSLFGWEGLHLKTFQDKEKHIISKIIDNTNDVLSASVIKVKEAYSALDPLVSTDPLCITVSFDGSWHKRGHTSMYGFASVIDVLTGLVPSFPVYNPQFFPADFTSKRGVRIIHSNVKHFLGTFFVK